MALNARAIGRNIQMARMAQGLTQQQLADQLKIDRGTVGRWESGMAKPRRAMFPELALTLKVSAPSLLVGAEHLEVRDDREKHLRDETATLKNLKKAVNDLTQITSRDEKNFIKRSDRILSDLEASWGEANLASRLMAAYFVTGKWDYRLKLLNLEIDLDETILGELRRVR